MNLRACGNGRMKTLALLMGAAFFLAPSADASIIQTATFSGTDSVTDTPGGGSTSGSHTYETATFNKFDSSLGVLTGVKVTLTSTRTQTTVLNGTSSNSGNKTNTGSNSVTGKLTAPGVSSSFSTLSQSGSCGKGGSLTACPKTIGPTGSTTNATYNLSSGSFSSYSGPGTVNVSLSSKLTATNTASGPWTSTSDAYTVDWSGTVGVEYSYDQHSDASFNSASTNVDVLTLDFGTVDLNSSPSAQMFDIYNLLKSDLNADLRLGLSYDAADSSQSGDTGQFSISSPFSIISALSAGSADSFSVNFDTSQIGTFSAIYNLAFVDASGQDCFGSTGSNYLTLKIIGNVVDSEHNPPPPLPEPGTLALIGGGLLLLGGLRLRRRSAKS